MSRATPPLALSLWEFLVKILKPENDGVLEPVKNVSCNPNTAGLYLLESRVSSSKLAWKPRMFHWMMECAIASVSEVPTSDYSPRGVQCLVNWDPDWSVNKSVRSRFWAWALLPHSTRKDQSLNLLMLFRVPATTWKPFWTANGDSLLNGRSSLDDSTTRNLGQLL